MKKSLICLCILIIGSSYGSLAGEKKCSVIDRQVATIELMELVDSDPDLRISLQESIRLGQIVNPDPKTNPVASIEDYYDFIDALVTYDPRNINTGLKTEGIRISMDGKNYCNWNILDILAYSYFLVDQQITSDPRGQIQFVNHKFSEWMRSVAEHWGKYLETKESARFLPSFVSDPEFGHWYCPDKPYATFQEFFTRELCKKKFPTGSRPVEGYADTLTVASVADSNTMGTWPISDDGKIVSSYDDLAQSGRVIKGQLYSDIPTFITGGPGETILQTFGSIDPDLFNGGTFTHQFLNVNNYHRLHVPVAGKLVYMAHIQSGTRMKSGWKPAYDNTDAHYEPRDTSDWQFGQTRLVLAIKTPNNGVVVATPMGMAQVASIQLRSWVQENAEAKKGWEFGNFAFGGSDFVVLFEKKANFVLTVPKMAEVPPGTGVNYHPSLQGQRYGCFGGNDTCSTTPETPPSYPQ